MKKNKNLCKIRIKGLNQERILSKLCLNYSIYNLVRIEKAVSELEIAIYSSKQVINFLKSEGFEVEVISKQGVLLNLKRFFLNYGVVCAIVACLITYLTQYNFIWQIKVYGTEYIKTTEIVEYINDNFSNYKNNIKTETIEIGLKDKFDRISSVSVAIVGQSLVVNINEAIIPDEMQSEFSPIYAEVDCMIKEIELIQGTIAVKQGQVVQKGDVLVYPYIIDAEGKRRDVNPKANITAEVWLIGKSEHSDGYYNTYRTGKVVEKSCITLFGLKIYENNQNCNFENFEIVKSSKFLSRSNILPLKIEKEIFYELKTELIEKSFEDVKNQKIEEAKQKALISLREYDIIKSEDINICSGAGVSIVEYVISAERKIGVKYEDLHTEG